MSRDRRSSNGFNHRKSRSRRGGNPNRISFHFSKKDFKCKSGLSNKLKISAGLVGCLEYMQSQLKSKIKIEKGYECLESAEKNKRIKRNYYTQGLAVDISAESTPLESLFRIAESILEFTTIAINYDTNCLQLSCVKGKDREFFFIKNGIERVLDSKELDALNTDMHA